LDTFADFLTRIRNGLRSRQKEVTAPFSRMKYEVARVLMEEGFVSNFQVDGEGTAKRLIITLKYEDGGASVIRGLEMVSKQSRRVYVGADGIPRVLGGLGVAIMSTPRGIVTDKDARRKRIGGEVLCRVW
jgi:small subunit ribosomal protein S8